MFSVIAPIYNRKQNTRYMLESLKWQVNAPEFEVIIVDDGSTDGLRDWLWETYKDNYDSGYMYLRRMDENLPDIRLKYFSGGPNKGFRGGRARNIGAFNADPRSTRFVFVDSDVVLNEKALSYYVEADKAHPNAIIVGMYHWLQPIDWSIEKVEELIKYEPTGPIEQLVTDLHVTQTPNVINDSPFGYDIRKNDFSDDISKLIDNGNGLGAFSGNIAYPKDFFLELGGFNEVMVGHGGEDAWLGLFADQHSAKWLRYGKIFGWHLWHPRDQARNSKEVQRNIAFIDAYFGIGMYKNARKSTDSRDWTSPEHYHKFLGCVLMKTDDNPTVFSVRLEDNKRLGISSMGWLNRLGFETTDIKVVTNEQLSQHQLMGATPPDNG